MIDFVAPSIETIREYDLEPFIRRALGLIHMVHVVADGWFVNGHFVYWDGAGFICDCINWGMYNERQGGYCKHSLAVCLRSESYRDRIIRAIEEVCHV